MPLSKTVWCVRAREARLDFSPIRSVEHYTTHQSIASSDHLYAEHQKAKLGHKQDARAQQKADGDVTSVRDGQPQWIALLDGDRARACKVPRCAHRRSHHGPRGRTRLGRNARRRAGSSSMQSSQGPATRRRPRTRFASDRHRIHFGCERKLGAIRRRRERRDERQLGWETRRISIYLAKREVETALSFHTRDVRVSGRRKRAQGPDERYRTSSSQ